MAVAGIRSVQGPLLGSHPACPAATSMLVKAFLHRGRSCQIEHNQATFAMLAGQWMLCCARWGEISIASTETDPRNMLQQ